MMNKKVLLSSLVTAMVFATFAIKDLSAQTYESSAPGYWELQPQFIDQGGAMNIYFNLEIWDDPNNPWHLEYDHMSQFNLSWDGVIIYRVQHNGIHGDPGLGSAYTVSSPTTTRFESASSYSTYTRTSLEDDITVTYTNTFTYNNTYEVTQVHIRIPYTTDMDFQSAPSLADQFEIYSYYRDRSPSTSSVDDYAGTHYSQTLTYYALEENSSGNDEVDFSITYNSDEGKVDVSFRGEKREGENFYDHLSCIEIHAENLTKETDEIISKIGHNSLGCSQPSGYPTTSFSGVTGESYTFSIKNNDEVYVEQVKRTYPPTSWHYFEYPEPDDDGYFKVQHYFDADDFGDEIRYYITGLYYARDVQGGDNQPVDWWVNESTVETDIDYSLPYVTGLTVTPSATNCEIDLSWDAYTSFGDALRNRVAIYRDGNLITIQNPQVSTTYTDTDVQPGVTYSYQAVAEYERDRNGRLKGNPSGAKNGNIPLPDEPFGLALTQGACASDITVDWGWTGPDPQNFILQRKTSTTGFVVLDDAIPGGARSFIDDNDIVSGELYSYKIAAVDGACSAPGGYTDVVTLTGDTIDISISIAENALQTSKGYFANRTELFWSTTGNNDQYLNRFKIYAREVGSTVAPVLLQTVNESVRTWLHETGDAGVAYEYFVVGERVVSTSCGTLVTSTFEVASLEGFATQGNLPGNELGVAYAVGFRYPTGIVNGNITYSGGVAVPDVKVVAEKYSGNNGNSLYFDGTDYVEVPHGNYLEVDSAMTLSGWFKFEALDQFAVIMEKSGSYGIHIAVDGSGYFYIKNAADHSEHQVSIPASSITTGNWVNITGTYSQATRKIAVYINGDSVNARILSPSLTGIRASSFELSIGRQASTENHYYQGYMDETKLFNRALSAQEVRREAGAVSATNANGLIAYWKMFVGIGNNMYDASHEGSTYHKNDGTIYGANWTTDIPSTTQLGFAGYTDANGNYSINGIGYSGTGENFNIIPSITLGGAVHEFDPSARTLFIGEGNTVQNNIDFEDISSFSFSGNVRFLFDDVEGVPFQSSGSEGIRLYLDGTTVITGANSLPFETDQNGFFDVDVPIGQHFIEFRKNGHVFRDEGRFPATSTWDFQEDLAGVEIWDSTTHTLIGKVVGGTFEAEKPVGFDKTVNNIGKAMFTLTSEDGKIIRNIESDSLTGEFVINLPPKKYISSSVKWVANSVDIINSGDIAPLDLADVFAYNGTYEEDSIFVNDTLVGIDSVFYHVRKDFVHREVPQLVVGDTSGSGISGEMFYQFNRGDTIINIDLSTLPFPAFFSAKDYVLKMTAAEVYTNLDNAETDTVVVTDGQITVNNNIGLGFYVDENGSNVEYGIPEVIDLNTGTLNYTFRAMDPNINEVTSAGLEHTSFTKQLSVTLEVGSYSVSWPNPAMPTEAFPAYVLGAKAIGNSFVTKAPPVVDVILRDPPGSNSYAFWENSVIHTTTEEFYVGGFGNADASFGVGIGTNTLVGGGIMGVGEIAESHLFGTVGFSLSTEVGGGGEVSHSTTFDESIETNADPIQVGSADVFVAKSQNLQSGLSAQVRPVPISECGGNCYGDTMYDAGGGTYRMSRVFQNYLNPVGTPTYLNFSESHIVNVLLPDLELARNSFFNNADYTSNIPPNHPLYGTNNDDPAWEMNATTTNHIRTEIPDFDGMSYTFNWGMDSAKVDSIRHINQQIRLWEEALAMNEIEKWMAKTYSSEGENISMSSGNVLTRSKTTTNSSYSYFSFETSSSISAGMDAAFDGWGLGFEININAEIGMRSSGQNSKGTEESLTTGYVLHDADEDDALSIDVFPSEDKNGVIFSTVGGQTMCPFEDEIVMQYATPALVQTLIDAQNGDIDKAEEEALAFGLIGASQEQAASQAEADEINLSVQRLQALLTAMQGGEVVLSNATLQRDKPTMLINGAKTAQAFNVPADEKANFTLLLQNESETFDHQWYGIQVLDNTNPNGLEISIDGEIINQQREFLVPGGSAIQKVMQVARGPFDYDYTDVQVIIHSTCQYDPTGNAALIVDTVTFDVSFLPTCSDIEIINPDDQWTANNSFDNEFPITVGEYDVNSTGFEKVKLQYKPSSSSSWTLLETYFRDTTISGWTGEPTLPQTGNTVTYNWQLGLLPDGNYDLRAVSECALAEKTSVIHSGVMDRLNPTPFGAPQPSDGILSPGEEISIQFNEIINEGLLSTANFDIRGVLNGGDIRHDASVHFDGISNEVMIEQLNLANKSFSIEFYAKRTQDGVNQVMLSQGLDANTEMSIGFDALNKFYFKLAGKTITANNATDNEWHHYAVTYNRETSDGLVYVDAIMEGVDNSFNVNYTQNEKLYIGKSNTGSGAHFEGNIHEVRIWSKELTLGNINIAAVSRMIGNEVGLLHNWEMEDGFGNLALDKVRGKHAQVNATWVVEPVGYALRLNGEVDQAELLPVSFDGSSDYTVEFWFKSDGGTDEVILSNGTGDFNDVNTSGWSLGIDASGNFYAQSNDEVVNSSISATDGQWHHVALVTKAQGNAILFMDAQEMGSIDNDSLNGFAGPALWIGQQGWFTGAIENNAKQYTGSIDELRLWNAARTLVQIDRDRYNKLSGNEPGLIEYYPFETYTTNAGITTVTSDLGNASTSNLAVNTDMTITGTAALTQVTPTIKLERPIQAVNFTYVVNNDKIIITPNIDDWKIENVQLDFTVSNIQDLNGNTLVSPVTWSAYIDRNQVVWQDQVFNMETEKGVEIMFESAVVNNSGQVANYTISNIPSWLEVSQTSGSVGPLSTALVSFTVPTSVNNGTYQQDILLTTDFGYAERLDVTVKVKQLPPSNWTVTPSNFQNSMNIVGQIAYDGVISRNGDDMLGVFVNNECRGIASLDYLSAYDNYQVFLSIYSNAASGEELEFRIWNAATGAVHTEVTHNLPSSTFVTDAFYGTSATPELFDANNYLAGTLDVPAGWKWVSFNLEGDDLDVVDDLLDNLSPSVGNIIKTRVNVKNGTSYTQTPYFDTYSNGFGWTGSITQNDGAKTGVLYKLNISKAGIIEYEGALVDPTEDTVNLVVGWNYLGYVGTQNTSITEGLSNYTPSSGDVIKSQYQSAIYDLGLGWLGSLVNFEPGEGYMIKTATEQSFTYPEFVNGLNKGADENEGSTLLANSTWETQPNLFADNMTMIAHINNDDELYSIFHSNNGLLGAFVGEQCRGIAYPQYNSTTDEYVYVLTVSGNDESEKMSFRFFDIENEIQYTAFESTSFENNSIQGTPKQPFELTLSSVGSGKVASSDLMDIYPNPFADQTNIVFNLPEALDVNISLEDLSGRILRQYNLGERTSGVNYFKINSGNLASGIYFVKVRTSGLQYEEKVMIAR